MPGFCVPSWLAPGKFVPPRNLARKMVVRKPPMRESLPSSKHGTSRRPPAGDTPSLSLDRNVPSASTKGEIAAGVPAFSSFLDSSSSITACFVKPGCRYPATNCSKSSPLLTDRAKLTFLCLWYRILSQPRRSCPSRFQWHARQFCHSHHWGLPLFPVFDTVTTTLLPTDSWLPMALGAGLPRCRSYLPWDSPRSW